MVQFSLDAHFEGYIAEQIAAGRYADATEVIRDALRHMEQRQRAKEALDAALALGLADAEAGRLVPIEQAFDTLERRLEKMVQDSGPT